MKTLTLKQDNKIAELIFDMPDSNVNLLTADVLAELEVMLDELKNTTSIDILFIKSAKKDIFIAGADINEIDSLDDEDEAYEKVRRGQIILRKITVLPFTTIAVIDGACMGGGLELALNCTYRVATQNPKTKIGLPEVSLGVLPGFSGTQTLRKIVGEQKALELILGSKILNSAKAEKLGLVDFSIPNGYLEFKLDSLAKEPIKTRKHKDSFIESFMPFLIYKFALKEVMKKTKGKYPAPIKVIELFEKTREMPINEALSIEAREFAKLALTQTSKNLIRLFFTSEELKKDSGVKNKVSTKDINTTAVIGGGTMGGGIVWLLSKIDLDVRLKTRGYPQVAQVFKVVNKSYDAIMKRRRLTKREVDLKLANITYDTEYRGFDVDLAIEAVVENVEAKQECYQELEKCMKDDAIIATNTSSLSITELGSKMKHQERFIGMHFFNPVPLMPLVEVIPSTKTDDETIATVVKLAKKAGKTPIVVGECAGFVVNRILLPYINESIKMLEEGTDIKHIDTLMEDFGMPMGPLTLADEVGLDVGYKVAKVLEDAYGDRMHISELFSKIYLELKLLGKKSQEGFYIHEKNEKTPNPSITHLLKQYKILSDPEIIDRAMFIMINEASMVLQEGQIKNAQYLDLAMVMGTGYAPFRGGILRYADSLGIKKVYSTLKNLQSIYGDRFEPSELIVQMHKDDKNFYEG